MRLIDADALKKAILEERDKIPFEIVERYPFGVAVPYKPSAAMRGGIRKALRCMEETSTVDAVQVVRCKDCKFFCPYDGEEHKGDCMELVGLESCVYEDDFCSYGERRKNNETERC